MKKRQFLVVAGVLALAIIAIIVWKSLNPNSPATERPPETADAPIEKSNKAATESRPVAPPARNESASNAESKIDPVVGEPPPYQMVETSSSFDPVADAKRRENAPFRVQGRGSKAKILTADGKILIEADEKVGIYGCYVSPNGKLILVYSGDATYDVITPSSGEKTRLPQMPPGDNVLGFSWRWLDDQTLIGVSGKTIPFRDDQVGTEREEPIISRSVLYLYDLKKQQLSEVALPRALRTKNVSVSAVDETGKVQLRPEGREVSYTDASLGWFDIRPKNDPAGRVLDEFSIPFLP